jgi:phage tail-like protein
MTAPTTSASRGGTSLGMVHHFTVRVDDSSYDLGDWSKASGLTVNWEVCQHRAGDQGNAIWLFPGNTKYETIKLTRAACKDSASVQKWLADTSKTPKALSGAVALVDAAGDVIVRWPLTQFFPIGWAISEFEAGTSRVATETLTLAHAGFLNDGARL